MGLKDNLSSMYDSAADSAKNLGNRAMETAKDVSENEVFKAVVFDKDDPVDVALTAAGAVTGGASIGAKAIYKGAKIAKAASKVFKSEKVADTALTIGKKIGSGAEAAKDVFSKGTEAVSGKISETSEAAKNVFSKGSEYLGKKVEQGKEAAGKIVSEGMEKASEITTKAKESATDIFKRGRDVATEKVEQAKESAKNLFKREPKTKTSKEKFDEFFDKKPPSKTASKTASKTFKRLAGVSALGGGIAAIKDMFGKESDQEDQMDQEGSDTLGENVTPGVITGTGKISPASSLTPNITPPENIETSAAEMTPIGEGGAGGLGDARSILEKIYMVLQQTHRTVEKISIDTGNLVRYSSMKDISADLAGANAMARIGEGVAYGGGGSSSYSPYSGSTSSKSKKEKEKEDGLFKSILKKAGITAGLYGIGGGFDETPMLDEAGDWVSDKWSVAKDYLGFGEGYDGPTLESVKKLSKNIMPETSKSLEKEEMMGSIDKSGKYSPSSIDRYLQASALIESGGNPLAKAETSSASGLYQFTKGTWKQMTKEMGKNYSLEDRFDPAKSLEVMKYFTEKNKRQFEKGTGKEATNTDLYMTHFMGAGGAVKFSNALQNNPNTVAANLMPEAAAANKNIYYKKSGEPRTLKEVYEILGKKVSSAEQSIETGKWGNHDIPELVKNIAPTQTLIAEQQTTIPHESLLATTKTPTIPTINDQLSNLTATEKKSDSPKGTLLANEEIAAIPTINDQLSNLTAAEKKSDSIISNPPAQEPVVLAQNTTAKANEATKSNSSAPVQKSMNMADSKQSTNNNQPLGNVRDDDPLILSMQYSNLRTV